MAGTMITGWGPTLKSFAAKINKIRLARLWLTLLSFVSRKNGLKKIQFLLRTENLHIKIDFFSHSSSLLDPLFTAHIKRLNIILGHKCDLHFLYVFKSLNKLVTELKYLEEVLLPAFQDCVATVNHFFVHLKVVRD